MNGRAVCNRRGLVIVRAREGVTSTPLLFVNEKRPMGIGQGLVANPCERGLVNDGKSKTKGSETASAAAGGQPIKT